MSSLNATRKLNALSPSCASGMLSKLAVSSADASSGPRTVVEIPCDSSRPSAVQIAPVSSHGRHASSDTVTSPSESGSISNSQTTSPSWPPTERVVAGAAAAPPGALPSTGRTDVTSPPSTFTPCSGPSATASLNPTRTLIRFDPSCCAGCDANHARNGIRTPCSSLDESSRRSTV